MEQERSHDRILLGSPESLYVETVSQTDIKISVKQPVGGWIVGEIKPEVTSSCHKCHGFYCRKENFHQMKILGIMGSMSSCIVTINSREFPLPYKKKL